MSQRPFLRSAIQVVGDFRIGDFDLQSLHVDHKCRSPYTQPAGVA